MNGTFHNPSRSIVLWSRDYPGVERDLTWDSTYESGGELQFLHLNTSSWVNTESAQTYGFGSRSVHSAIHPPTMSCSSTWYETFIQSSNIVFLSEMLLLFCDNLMCWCVSTWPSRNGHWRYINVDLYINTQDKIWVLIRALFVETNKWYELPLPLPFLGSLRIVSWKVTWYT